MCDKEELHRRVAELERQVKLLLDREAERDAADARMAKAFARKRSG